MKLRNYLCVIWIYLAFEATLARRCDKRPSQIAQGRRCRKTCVDNTECNAARKTCNCDGECGMSCYNPEAVCSEPETIPHGSVSRSSLKMQSVATYSCIAGYVIKGTRKRTCRADKKWYPEIPRCERKQCPPPLIPRNGRFVYQSLSTRNEYDTKIKYSCDVGFRLEGNISTTCDYTGSWDDPPICIDIKCPQPPTSRPYAARSRILYASGNLLLPNSNVHYQCNNNFKVSGLLRVFHFATSVCEYQEATGNSAWNPALDTIACEEIFCNRPHVGMLHDLHNNKESWRVGETVTASCKKGYGFSLERFVDTVTCTDSGEWHSSFTPCQAIRCPEPQLRINNGKRDSKSDTDVTYRCDENYQIYASNRVTTKTVKCIRYYGFRRSEWSLDLNDIRCERITCRNPPQNWHMEAYEIDRYRKWRMWRSEDIQNLQRSERGYAGQQTIFRCAKGYEFDYTTSTNLSAQCLATGRWENSLKPCVEDIKCPEPPVRIMNGNRQTVLSGPVSPESVATYRCHSGYGISHGNTYTGEANITCTKNIERLGSTWNPSPIQIGCRDLKCITPPELQKNAIQISVTYASGGLLLPESVVHYQCTGPNYIFSGSPWILRDKRATCRYRSTSEDSAWDPPLDDISCERGCIKPSRIAYAYLPTFRESFPVNKTVQYKCSAGYYTNADRTIKCMKSGKWTAANFICRQKTCRQLIPSDSNGHIVYSSRDYYGSIAILHCDRGFYHEPIGRRQICTSGRTNSQIGSWSGPSLGHCLRKQCPPPLIPRNGRFVYVSLSTRNEYDTKIKYSCDVGFRLEGTVSTTCDYTGSWDDPPICIDIKCPQPPTSRLHATRSWIVYASGNLLLPNSNVHYQCTKNFKVSGLLRVFHFATSVCEYQEATGNSAWNPALDTIACEEIFCNRPHVGMHHNLHNNKESWRVGETVTASCKKGYGFSLERFVDTVTCTDSGEWHSSFTSCQDIRCPEPKLTINNGKRDNKSDTDVTYRCDENYQIYDSNRVTTKTVKCIRYYGFRKSEWALDLNDIRCERKCILSFCLQVGIAIIPYQCLEYYLIVKSGGADGR